MHFGWKFFNEQSSKMSTSFYWQVYVIERTRIENKIPSILKYGRKNLSFLMVIKSKYSLNMFENAMEGDFLDTCGYCS